MPNWVYNTLHVHSPDKESLDKFIRKTTKPIPTVKTDGFGSYGESVVQVIDKVDAGFSFWNIIRPKKKLWVEYWTRANSDKPQNNWYNWNTSNWGCKWDASDPDVERGDDTYATITFSTPWSPPIGIVENIGRKFPDLSFTWAWEEDQGFGGEWEIQGDDVSETDSYDIPDSHAEMMGRKGYCYCEDYEDEEDFPWSDCPRGDAKLGDPIQIAPFPTD